MALALGWPGTEIPYSVSMPITRRTVMRPSLPGVGPLRGRRSSTAAVSGACAVPVTALRDSAVPQSLERLCAGGELHYDIVPARPERGMKPAAEAPGGFRSRSAYYRYWPVLATVSMERPVSAPCFPVTSVRMKTIRSPFLPEILAQSSGLVVFGRSSFSLNSSTQACRR